MPVMGEQFSLDSDWRSGAREEEWGKEASDLWSEEAERPLADLAVVAGSMQREWVWDAGGHSLE